MAIVGIVAVDRRGAIGKDGSIPWHYSSDLKFFRRQTTANVCVMGYRTWLSIGKPLPQRLNIVMSRSSEIEPRESVILLRDRVSVLSLMPYLSCDLFIIGGVEIFQTFREDIDRWIVTEIPLTVEAADTFMPGGYLDGFRPVSSLQLEDDLKVTFHERAS